MKTSRFFSHLAVLAALALSGTESALAQGTAFTYQGLLINTNGTPASGLYDFTFNLSPNSLGTITQAVTGTLAVPVTNGVFTTTIDFGTGIFTGGPYWLQILVRTNGAGSYSTLSPLQPLKPAPYAIFANTANNLTGALSSTQLTGVISPSLLPAAVVTNTETGVTLGGGFTGNGGGLTNLNASQLTSGVVSNSVLPNFQASTGYAGIGAGSQNAASGGYSVVGGGNLNSASGIDSTVGGGYNNTAANFSTVGGGYQNSAAGVLYGDSTVAGGTGNHATGDFSVIGGGQYNTASNGYATVPGGANNIAGGQYSFAAGRQAQATNQGAFVWADSQSAPFGSTNTNSFNVRANGGVVFATSGTGISVDGVSVLTAAPGSIQGYEINDGGNGAYQTLQNLIQTVGGDTSVVFSNLVPVVATNGTSPSLALTINGATFGTVLGFTGFEAMSQPCFYVVEAQSTAAVSNPDSELGFQGSLTYSRNSRSTTFAGIVTGCTLASSNGANFLYLVRLESPLALMALSSDYKIKINTAVPSAATSLYTSLTGSSASTTLAGSYPALPSVTQYGETGLNFFSRLLEREGIFYFFNQAASPPSLVMGDSTSAYLSAPNGPFNYYGNSPSSIPAGAEYVQTFQKAYHQSSLQSAVNSYDFTTPTASLNAINSGSEGVGQTYEFGNSVATLAYDQQLAKARQDFQTASRSTLSGTATAPDLRPGYTFTLSDQTSAGLSGAYLVTTAHHAAFLRVTNGVSTLFYGNQITAIPSSLTFRPAQRTPLPNAVPCTAVVTGPGGDEIYTDEYGRVKVQFHWDRYGVNDQNSSEWMRVASPWAGGGGRGVVFIPRIGDEVLVSFLEGDPDQPVVTGSLYNGNSKPPYTLPDAATQSGIKTLSSTGGGGDNELRFDDKKGSEDFSMHAQKNMEVAVLNNLTESVTGNIIQTVGGLYTNTVTGNAGEIFNTNMTLSVGNNFTESVGGNVTETLSGNVSKSVTGSVQENYNSDLTRTITKTLTETVGINKSVTVTGSASETVGNNLTENVGGSISLSASGSLSLAGSQLNLNSPVTASSAVQLNNNLTVGGTTTLNGLFTSTLARTGGFGQPVADIENLDTSANCSPALRLVAHGSPLYGALCVSTAGPVSSTNTNSIVSFGNNNLFVSWLDNNGNWYAKGNVTANTFLLLCDRNAKQDFAPVTPRDVLDKVAALPVSEWSYTNDTAVRHIGPMAQDFYAAFNLGMDERHIATVDEGGVALAAIQGLNQKLDDRAQALQDTLKSKNDEIESLKLANTNLEKRLDALEKLVYDLSVKK